jgi:hypothetical protein
METNLRGMSSWMSLAFELETWELEELNTFDQER